MAAGTVTQTIFESGSLVEVVCTCTASADNASYPATVLSSPVDGYVQKVTTNPGTTEPTDDWDFTLTDQDSVDVMGDAGANRDKTNSEVVYPKDPDSSIMQGGVPVKGQLTLNISNNSVNSAVIVLRILILKIH
jgi:hypothetical protein